MPLMTISYALQYFDKTSLGYAAIMGIIDDTHLEGTEYNWLGSAFYFGYLFASYPASFAFVKLPLAKFLAACILLWAVVLACHGAAGSFATLMVLRILLGVFESTVSPGLSLVTGLWYKPEEHVLRHGIWFVGTYLININSLVLVPPDTQYTSLLTRLTGNGCASLVGGLLAYAISHIGGPIEAWRWLFIIFGLITFAWAILLFIFLPDSPGTARFLSDPDKIYAGKRSQAHTRSFKSSTWKKSQCIEALTDPKTWFLFIYTICSTVPNGGFTNVNQHHVPHLTSMLTVTQFSSLIVKGFGFSTFTTLLLNMPIAAFQIIWVVIGSGIAWKLPRSRCYTIAALQLTALTGAAMVYAIPSSNKWARMAGIWLFPAYAAGFPLSLSLIASNVAGYTKKTTVSALLFIAYCVGNIIGPQIFFHRQAPRYQSGFMGIIICFALSTCTILGMRWYMARCNKMRNAEQGRVIDPEAKKDGSVLSTEEHLVRTGEDQTDWENGEFRYYL